MKLDDLERGGLIFFGALSVIFSMQDIAANAFDNGMQCVYNYVVLVLASVHLFYGLFLYTKIHKIPAIKTIRKAILGLDIVGFAIVVLNLGVLEGKYYDLASLALDGCFWALLFQDTDCNSEQ